MADHKTLWGWCEPYVKDPEVSMVNFFVLSEFNFLLLPLAPSDPLMGS